MPSYDMQAWSLQDIGNPTSLGVGDSFTVSASATADIVTVTDGGTDDTPDDFNPIDSDQLVSGIVDGTTYSSALHQYEIAFQVTDGSNSFIMVWVNTGPNQQGNNQAVTSDGYFVVMEDPANPGGGGIVPGTTYTITSEDLSVNFSNGGFNATPQYSDFFVCFARGTLIGTVEGDRPVETLHPGDLIRTRDDGPQPLRWIGGRRVPGRGDLAPVVIGKAVLGNRRRLRVSPQHRLLIDGPRAELLFGEREVLVAAKHLIDGRRIRSEPCDHVEYWHLLFDRHQIVLAEGIAAESFHPADQSINALDHAARDEVLRIFPELRGTATAYGPLARPAIGAAEARAFLAIP